MSTALLKQMMLVTFKQTSVHTLRVLNEGRKYAKGETVRNSGVSVVRCVYSVLLSVNMVETGFFLSLSVGLQPNS